MVPASDAQVLVDGHATAEGTQRYRKRFSSLQPPHFYRPIAGDTLVSALGFGTYLGECDDSEDARYVTTIGAALERGVNLLDTAINYRCQRSERAIGKALRNCLAAGAVERDEIVVCTKGGYIPLELTPPESREGYKAFLDSEYFGPGVMDASDVVAGGHCLTPRYIENQIDRSRANMGLATIDVYYLHNPEQQLDALARPDFFTVLGEAFTELERQVRRGAICSYGCATWNGFRAAPGSKNHLSIEELVGLAGEVGGGDHHFRVVQLPISLAMAEAVRLPTQCVGNEKMPLLDAARELGVSVVGSATLMQSQLTRSLPDQVRSAFPGFRTDARRAIAFSQSLPMASALVGMKSVSHLEENLAQKAGT
ncbi:MAG TPA: aldo/keto reductase [Gemmatimonadaceae bacterium]|jgi:aryl-alcohol dehydrogenase-like predicted oxidoreductase